MNRTLFLDIETDWNDNITVIGTYSEKHGFKQLAGDDVQRSNLLLRKSVKTHKIYSATTEHSFENFANPQNLYDL